VKINVTSPLKSFAAFAIAIAYGGGGASAALARAHVLCATWNVR